MNDILQRLGLGLLALSFGNGMGGAASAGEPITLQSLVNEMIDRDALARFPAPFYTCRQSSSYDRESVAPDKPGWFANNDRGQFIREETNGGRREWVLVDTPGPGCICRIWTPIGPQNQGGTLRFYFDGSPTPSLEADFLDLMTGKAFIGEPWAAVREKGGNLYLPIPYANGCKITLDKAPFYYHFNCRTYEPGTRVETFSLDRLEAARGTLKRIGETLIRPPAIKTDYEHKAYGNLEPDGIALIDLLPGPAAIRQIELQIDANDLERALRSTVIQISFDGKPRVWCPIGDFFGSGVGLNPFSSWNRTVEKDGWMRCRWVMPYARSADILLECFGPEWPTFDLRVQVGDWKWNDRSMHFHGNWRHQNPVPTEPKIDWNYIEAKGQGVYVADTLAVFNPVALWWGEGDEKIYVDGESFPSHFGTGSEDYYGYAWGGQSNGFFSMPFIGQVRCDGPRSRGHTTLYRERALDAIPFRRSLNFNIEVWHAGPPVEMAYAATTLWYARPRARGNVAPAPDEAKRPIPQLPAETPPAKP